MFYRLAAFILLIVSLLFNFSTVFIQLDFNYNQAHIIKEYCVNKNKPELHCNGQCYLRKKLKQAEEKEQKQSLKAQEQTFPRNESYAFNRFFFERTILLINYQAKTLSSNLGSIFHPPQILSV
jgi:hypothetical protein